MQRVADLEAERVARTEPARHRSAREHRVPQSRRVFARDEQLDPTLAGVPRSVDDALDPVDPARRERERRRVVETEALDRAGTLHGEESALARDVAHVRATRLALLQPLIVVARVRRVDDQEVPARLEPVDDQVVDDAATLVREERVLRTSDLDPVEVVREQALEEVLRVRALDLELTHVRDVEDAAVRADGPMLFEHAGVLHRHVPAGERHHPCAERHVTVMKRCLRKGLHGRGCYSLSRCSRASPQTVGGGGAVAAPTLGRSGDRL